MIIYFTKENFPRKKQEVLLDVGGYNGDSIKDLHIITSGNYNHIISLEPFPKMFKDLKALLRISKLKIDAALFKLELGVKKLNYL